MDHVVHRARSGPREPEEAGPGPWPWTGRLPVHGVLGTPVLDDPAIPLPPYLRLQQPEADTDQPVTGAVPVTEDR